MGRIGSPQNHPNINQRAQNSTQNHILRNGWTPNWPRNQTILQVKLPSAAFFAAITGPRARRFELEPRPPPSSTPVDKCRRRSTDPRGVALLMWKGPLRENTYNNRSLRSEDPSPHWG